MDVLEKVVLFDEFVRDIGKADANIFRTSERGVEIEFSHIIGGKLGTLVGEDDIYVKFDEFERAIFLCRRCGGRRGDCRR